MASNTANSGLPQHMERAHIDPAKLELLQMKYERDISQLHAVFPPPYAPKVEYFPLDSLGDSPIYPGRVLLGTDGASNIYAVLRKLDSGTTEFEIYVSDDGATEGRHGIDMISDSVELEPWCSLIVCRDRYSGLIKNWNEQLESITKLAMLDAKWFDGEVSIDWPHIYKYIIWNINEGSFYPDSLLITKKAAMSLRSDAQGHSGTEDVEPSEEQLAPEAINPHGTELASIYIKALKSLLPWRCVLKSKRPGLVLLGRTAIKPSGHHVWAGLGQTKEELEILVRAVSFKQIWLDEYFEFLCTVNTKLVADRAVTRKVILPIAMKVALIQSGYLTGADFQIRMKPTPANIRNLLQEYPFV